MLYHQPIHIPSFQYGIEMKDGFIQKHVSEKQMQGVDVHVTKCGLFVMPSRSYLAASPDVLLMDPTAQPHNGLRN